VNSKDYLERTPLLWAAIAFECSPFTEMLALHSTLDKHTLPQNQMQLTLLELQIENMQMKLHYEQPFRPPVSDAVVDCYEGIVRMLLIKGADANSKDGHGRTPLSWAAQKGHAGIVKLLLSDKGVDASLPDHQGRTPLCWATINMHEAVIELLLAAKGRNVGSKYNNSHPTLSRPS
jgi:hypothetical protein